MAARPYRDLLLLLRTFCCYTTLIVEWPDLGSDHSVLDLPGSTGQNVSEKDAERSGDRVRSKRTNIRSPFRASITVCWRSYLGTKSKWPERGQDAIIVCKRFIKCRHRIRESTVRVCSRGPGRSNVPEDYIMASTRSGSGPQLKQGRAVL